MNIPQTTARPSVDLDATDEYPVLDAAAYEAEVLAREIAAASDGAATATESALPGAESAAADQGVADAASPVPDSDDMLAVEHWIAQKAQELRAHYDALTVAQRERIAAVTRAGELSRELAERSANLEALNGREQALAEALAGERAAAERRAVELDTARCEVARLELQLADARTAETRQNAALASSAALLEQRSGELQALQGKHDTLITDQQRTAHELFVLETRFLDSETRERSAQRTIKAQNHDHAKLMQLVQHETSVREQLGAEVKSLQAQLAKCVESLHSRESYRAIYESTLQELDAELAAARLLTAEHEARANRLDAELQSRDRRLQSAVEERDAARHLHDSEITQRVAERGEDEQRRSALESRLIELSAEHAGACARILAMEAALTAAQQRAETEALASGTAAERLRELESAIASRQAELTNARLESERNHASLADLTAALTAAQHRVEAEALASGIAAERQRELESAIASRQAELTNARLESERNRALLADLTAALLKSQTMFSDQSRVLEEREAAASAMALSHAEQAALIATLRGQIEELTTRLAAPGAERHALAERIAALTKEATDSDSRLRRLESMNSELRTTVAQLNTWLAERDAELQRATQLASVNAYALGRVQSSIDELGRTLAASEGAATQAQASILTRIDNGQNHSVVLRGRTTIGRDRDNDLPLAMRSVSRHHAVLIPAFRTAFVQDLKSTNGVLVNRRRVRCARLEHGDVITCGEAQFRYTLTPAPAGVASTGSSASGSARASLKHAS